MTKGNGFELFVRKEEKYSGSNVVYKTDDIDYESEHLNIAVLINLIIILNGS